MPEIKLPSSFHKAPTTKKNVEAPARRSPVLTRAESDKQWELKQSRSAWESTKAFVGAIPDAVDYFEETWGGALKDESILKGILSGDRDAKKALVAMPIVGTMDLARIGKMIIERGLEDDNLSDEEKKANYHRQQTEMINYMTDAREKYIEAVAGGKYKGDMRAGADFADITNVIGGSGVLVKGYTQGIRKGIKTTVGEVVAPLAELTAKSADIINKGLKIPEKITGSTTFRLAQLTGASAWVTGQSSVFLAPVALELGKMATKFAEKVGRNTAEIAKVFAKPSSHERFLYRLATDPSVSEKVRKLATNSHKLLGTKMYDVAFDALVGATSAGILQSALQYASGATDEQAGMAFGTGVTMGAPIGGLLGQRGSGKDRNALDAKGNLTARSQQGIREYIAKKNSVTHTEAITDLAKANPSSAVLLSTMDAIAPVQGLRMQILDLNEFAGSLGLDPKDAPSAHYDREMGLMILNKNDMQGAVAEASHIFAHEFGHHFMQQHLGKDITTRRQVLENYEDPQGKEFFFLDENGDKIKGIESVRLNGEAMSFAQNYADRVRKTSPDQADRILKDAGMLAEELGADMFASYFGQNPNVFDMFQPQFRSLLLGGARDSLAKFGIINPKTGAENAILPFSKIPKPLKNLYKNYLKESMEVQQARADAVDTGQKVFPKQGDTAQSSFKKTNGGLTWDLLAGNDFILKDQQMFDDFKDVMDRVTKDLDKKYVGLGRDASNQNMHPLIRDFLKKNSLRPDVMDAIVDMVDTLIASRERVRIGKRSGHQGQWSDYNPYYIHDITLFGYQFSPKAPRKNKNRKTGEEKISYPSMKVMAYNNEIVESNIQAMAQAGLLKKYNDDPQIFADALTAHAQKAFKKYGREDPINPQGKGENELFAIAFGSTTLKTDVLKDPINSQFWAKEGNGMKNAIKSYQIGELVGANTTGTKGFAVDYNNMKNNFMPSRSVGMNHVKQRKINWSGTTSFMPSLKNIETGEFSGRLKPYPMYRPTEGNMRMESHLKKQNIWKPDGTLDFQKSLHLGLNNDIATAIENGVMSVDKQLKPIDYDSKLRRNYRQDDPRRSRGNRLKDGHEHDGSPLSIRGEKGRVEEGGGGFVDFVHFPTRPIRRKVLKTDFHGTGIKGAEGSRKANYPELYSNRTYFGDGNYKPEKGLITDFAHHTRIDKNNLWTGKPHYNTKEFLHDFEAFIAEQGIQEAGNGKTGNTIGAGRQTAFETFLKKQGFLGMYAPNDHVGFMFHDIEVGTKSKPTSISYPPAFVPDGRSFMPSKGKDGSGFTPFKKERVDELKKLANGLKDGSVTPEQYQKAVDKYLPVERMTEKDIIPATLKDLKHAITNQKGQNVKAKIPKINQRNALKTGDDTALRLDIPSYDQFGVFVPTIYKGNKTVSHQTTAVITDATFGNKKGTALAIAKGGSKNPFATIQGKYKKATEKDAVALAKEALANKDGSWTQVGLNPERHSFFYDRLNNGVTIKSADTVVQVGRAVFAKNALKAKAKKAYGEGNYFMPSKNKEFNNWFGKSKIVDKDGDPLVVYHGTIKGTNHFGTEYPDFNVFDRQSSGRKNFDNIGSWFTDNKKQAGVFGDNIKEVFLSIKKPLVLKESEVGKDPLGHLMDMVNEHGSGDKFNDFLKSSGYDGIVLENIKSDDFEKGDKSYYLALEPNQIKSATENVGTFDPSNPDINYMPSKGKLTPEQLAEKQAKEAEQIKKDTLSYAMNSLTPDQKKVLKDNPDKSVEEALGGEWSKAYGDAKYHVELTHKIKKLEGNKKAVESQLTIKDYGDNEIDGSIALPARMGIINANKKGMFSSYKDVTDLIKSIVTKIEYTMEKNPEFAQRTALFYSDMGNTAYQMAQVIKFPERTLFDVADLQLRFLALGSPRSAVSANMTKSARSMMHPHGSRAGHKINPADQQIAGNRTAKEWDRGEHFEVLDPEAIGADDKVRNFYLNGLAELIEIAKVEGTQRDVDILLDRASKTLGLTKQGQNLSPEGVIKLQKLLDGLATVDMWDMAGKGYAHPAYIPISKRAKQQMKSPFHWSVEKHRKVHKAHGKYWNEAMKQMRYQHTKEIKHQQANALQIDGRKDWNEDNWAVRQNEPIDATTEWSYYTKADEDGLTPKGGGALYDAHQTVDGLIADELNKAGYAEFFGKKKLYARNAQEILWALTKLDNPLPSNQNLVLFGDRFTPLYEATMKLSELGQQIQSVKDLPNSQQVIDMLMTQADKTFGGELPTSATQIMSAVTDSYNKTATQILPFEVTTFGASREALAVQAQEKLMGQQAMTEKFSQGLGEQLQQIADGHGLRMRIDEVKVGQGGYTENGVTAVAPNITMALKGDPSVVNQVMVEISRGLDQADGNVFRRPTVKEVNMGGLNEAVTFDTTQLDPTQKKNFFTDLSTLVDGDGDSFLTGFTESTEGMFIADLYYKPQRLSDEIIKNRTAIKQIMGKHNVPTYKTEQLVADNYTRSDSMPVKPERPTARTAFARDVFNLTKAKINNLQNRKYDGLPQVADSVQRIYNQAEKVSSKHYNTSKLRENAMAEVQELVDIAGLEGFLDKDDAVLMKEEVKTIFKSNEQKNYFTKGTVEKKAFKRLTDRVKSRDKKKATKAQKKNILWAYRPQDKANEGRSSYFSEKQFQTLGKNIIGEGKSTDLIGGNLRKSAKTNYLFDSSSKSGRIKK